LTKRISVRKVKYATICTVIVLISAIYMLLNRNESKSDDFVKICIFWSLAVLAFECHVICRLSKSFLSPTILFLTVYYLFQNGQLLLYAVGIQFNTYYIFLLREHLQDVAVFSSVSNMLAGLSGVFSVSNLGNQMQKHKHTIIDKYDTKQSAFSLKLGVILTGMVAIPEVIVKFSYAIRGGYSAVRSLESSIPSIINFAEYMFVPFSFAFLHYSKEASERRFVTVILTLWCIITAFCGDRTTGIAGLFATAYIFYFNEMDRKRRYKQVARLVIIGVVLIFFVQLAYAFRTQSSIIEALSGENNVFISFVSDLGFSSFPLFTMMSIVPEHETFLWGKGYLLSMIGGIIPSFLDPTGTISWFNQQSRIFESWHEQYFGNYSFGFGFSLNAEAYINFGWYGLIVLFFVCLAVIRWLNRENKNKEQSVFSRYTVCILLFMWFTLPRRDTYYFWKAIVYCVFLMRIYLSINYSRVNWSIKYKRI